MPREWCCFRSGTGCLLWQNGEYWLPGRGQVIRSNLCNNKCQWFCEQQKRENWYRSFEICPKVHLEGSIKRILEKHRQMAVEGGGVSCQSKMIPFPACWDYKSRSPLLPKNPLKSPGEGVSYTGLQKTASHHIVALTLLLAPLQPREIRGPSCSWDGDGGEERGSAGREKVEASCSSLSLSVSSLNQAQLNSWKFNRYREWEPGGLPSMGSHRIGHDSSDLVAAAESEDFPGVSVVKNTSANAGETGSIPGPGRSSWEGNGNPLQYPCLGNPMDRGTWWATVHGVAKELGMT